MRRVELGSSQCYESWKKQAAPRADQRDHVVDSIEDPPPTIYNKWDTKPVEDVELVITLWPLE